MDSKTKTKTHKYKNKYRKSKQFTLSVGEKGFLCSCNNREKDCIRECYVILNKYADIEDEALKSKQPTTNTQSDEELEDELKKEIAALNSSTQKTKRFQVVESGAKNFLFIRTNLEDPVGLATTIIKDITETQQLQTRYLIRLIPIEVTCKAYIENIKNTCSELIEKHLKDTPTTFSIIYNHRNNDSLSRDVIIKEVADLVFKIRSDHVVDLNNAAVSIVIEVIRGIALIAIVPDYLKYKKFNLHSVHNLKKVNDESGEGKNDVNVDTE